MWKEAPEANFEVLSL